MGKLVLVPTPVGNLEDITYRAVRVLHEADLILAEDTRKTGILLSHYGIEAGKVKSHHKFNEHKTLGKTVSSIKHNMLTVLVSEAGTPGISDPGFLLTRECIKEELEVESLPGPTAFIPALVMSGLPCERFVFEGFLPHKKGRTKRLKELVNEERTMVFYESPFRLVKTLSQFAEYYGNERNAAVARELTKIYEEVRRGSLQELIEVFENQSPKGEFVIVLEGNK